jgi:hypothetical protein
MPAARLHRLRIYLTLVIATAHGALALLGVAGRLQFSVPSRYPLLVEVMGNDLWVWLHAAAAAALVTSLVLRRYEVSALGAATGIMGAWSFLNLLWGLSVVNNPVSLVGPVLGGGVATVAYLLCLSWARASGDSRAGNR